MEGPEVVRNGAAVPPPRGLMHRGCRVFFRLRLRARVRVIVRVR